MAKQTELFLFALAKITWGLLVHPYQTMQSLLRQKSFVWMTVLPSGVFFLVKSLWLLIIVPVVQYLFSCSTSYFVGCSLIPFFANWLTFFLRYLAGDVALPARAFFKSISDLVLSVLREFPKKLRLIVYGQSCGE